MNEKLRQDFEAYKKKLFNGTELLFETSNEKYINYLETIIIENMYNFNGKSNLKMFDINGNEFKI